MWKSKRFWRLHWLSNYTEMNLGAWIPPSDGRWCRLTALIGKGNMFELNSGAAGITQGPVRLDHLGLTLGALGTREPPTRTRNAFCMTLH